MVRGRYSNAGISRVRKRCSQRRCWVRRVGRACSLARGTRQSGVWVPEFVINVTRRVICGAPTRLHPKPGSITTFVAEAYPTRQPREPVASCFGISAAAGSGGSYLGATNSDPDEAAESSSACGTCVEIGRHGAENSLPRVPPTAAPQPVSPSHPHGVRVRSFQALARCDVQGDVQLTLPPTVC